MTYLNKLLYHSILLIIFLSFPIYANNNCDVDATGPSDVYKTNVATIHNFLDSKLQTEVFCMAQDTNQALSFDGHSYTAGEIYYEFDYATYFSDYQTAFRDAKLYKRSIYHKQVTPVHPETKWVHAFKVDETMSDKTVSSTYRIDDYTVDGSGNPYPAITPRIVMTFSKNAIDTQVIFKGGMKVAEGKWDFEIHRSGKVYIGSFEINGNTFSYDQSPVLRAIITEAGSTEKPFGKLTVTKYNKLGFMVMETHSFSDNVLTSHDVNETE